MKDFTIVTACSKDYIDKLRWCIPTWTIKPQFRNKKLLIFYIDDMQESDLHFAKNYFSDVKFVKWGMKKFENKRELVLSSFVLGVNHIETEYYVKIDGDSFFVNDSDVLEKDDFNYDLVAHRWGYTKPGYWIPQLDNFYDHTNNHVDKEMHIFRHPRIASFFCLHKTEFVKKVVSFFNGRMPVPSHDTTLWYYANKMPDRSWKAKNVKRYGVTNKSRFRSLKETICSLPSANNPYLNGLLLDKITLKVSDVCKFGCTKCNNFCGISSSDAIMGMDSIFNFIDDSIRENKKWKKIIIDIGDASHCNNLPTMLDLFKMYKDKFGRCKIELNVINEDILSVIKNNIPKWVTVNISNCNTKRIKQAIMNAPCDNREKNVRACSSPWNKGIAINKNGYFLCSIGASIARVFNIDIGIKHLREVNADSLLRQKEKICTLCGYSDCKTKQDGRRISKSWQQAIENNSLRR